MAKVNRRSFTSWAAALVLLLVFLSIRNTQAAVTFVRSGGVAAAISFSFDIGSAGTDRLVVVIADNESTGTNLTGVTVAGQACTWVATANNPNGAGNHQEMWYCDEDNLAGSSGTVTVAIAGGSISWGIHAHLYTGVSQGGPYDSGIDQTSVAVNTVTVTGADAIDVPAAGLVVMGAAEGTDLLTVNPWTSPLVERNTGLGFHPTSADLFSASNIEVSAQTAKTYQATFSAVHNRATGIVASWAQAAITIGNGTNPGNATLAPGGAATQLDAFTLQTNGGTDTVTQATVTLAAGTSAGISLVEITSDNGSTVYGSVSNPASDTVSISGMSVPATTTLTQFKVRITPKSHANMPAPPGSTYSVTGTVTSFTSTKPQLGTDSGSATITIDNLSPGNVTGASASPGDAQVTVSWTNPGDADFSNLVVLRNTATITDVPTEGSSPAFDSLIPPNNSVVRYIASVPSFIDTGLNNGQIYYYRIFAKDTNGNYSATGVEVSATPVSPFPDLRQIHYRWRNDDGPETPDWWDLAYGYRRKITFGTSHSILPAGFTASTTMDTRAASTNVELASGNDVRVVWEPTAGGAIELDRIGDVWDNVGTTIEFRLQSDIGANLDEDVDGSYYIYYGNSVAGTPPSNEGNVYYFADFFNRADSTTVGNGWTEWNDGTSNASITGNSLHQTGNNVGPPDAGVKQNFPLGALTSNFTVSFNWTIPINAEGIWTNYLNIGNAMSDASRTAGVAFGLYAGESNGLTGVEAVDNNMSGALENNINGPHTFQLVVNVGAQTFDYWRDGLLRVAAVAFVNTGVSLAQIRMANDQYALGQPDFVWDTLKILLDVANGPEELPGSEETPGTTTWAANEDTALNGLATSTLKRLRFEISNEGGATASGYQFRLQVSGPLTSTSPGTCAAASYNDLPTTYWEIFDSTQLTDGAATTNVTGGLTDENTTFVAGQVKDAGNETTGITLTGTQFTEIEYALQATASATPGALYCFRLTNAGVTTNFTYSQYGRVTIAGVDNFSVEAAGGGAIGPQFEVTPFSIRVTARDYLNVTATSFTGTVDITSTGTLSAGGGTTGAFTSGVLASHSVTIANPGTFTITATRTSGTATGTSNSFTVNAITPFQFRNSITIDRTKVPSSCGTTLTNFPMLYSVTDLDLRTTANGGDVTDPQGDDILFRALDDATCGGAGTAPCTLDHEIESYNGTTGRLVAWLRIPVLNTASASSDTVIYIYYGNPAITASIQNADGVWDSNYKGVWHLKETSGTQYDSTQNGNNATPSVTTQGSATGKINGADGLTGTLDRVEVGTTNWSASLDSHVRFRY